MVKSGTWMEILIYLSALGISHQLSPQNGPQLIPYLGVKKKAVIWMDPAHAKTKLNKQTLG